MCKRVVKRMLKHQLSMAWNEFVDCVCTTRENREIVRKVLARMAHRQLAGAFDCYAGAVDSIATQRERVAKTMARWKTPGLKKAWERWLDYLEVAFEQRSEVHMHTCTHVLPFALFPLLSSNASYLYASRHLFLCVVPILTVVLIVTLISGGKRDC